MWVEHICIVCWNVLELCWGSMISLYLGKALTVSWECYLFTRSLMPHSLFSSPSYVKHSLKISQTWELESRDDDNSEVWKLSTKISMLRAVFEQITMRVSVVWSWRMTNVMRWAREMWNTIRNMSDAVWPGNLLSLEESMSAVSNVYFCERSSLKHQNAAHNDESSQFIMQMREISIWSQNNLKNLINENFKAPHSSTEQPCHFWKYSPSRQRATWISWNH